MTISARAATTNAVVSLTVSPSVVSNTYNGLITLQIDGLTNGVTNVVVQKFLDVNTNGAIDSGDLLVQQFRLAAGQENVFSNWTTKALVTVTNFMPGDSSSTPGQMTVPLNFQNGDFAQTLVGHYLYKVSSPSSSTNFAAVTGLFVVTNANFSSIVTGGITNTATGAPITNAIVLLCVDQGGPLVVQEGTVVGSSGTFSMRAPQGSYVMAAAKSNFVENFLNEGLSFTNHTTNNGSVYLTPATTNITGRVINSANSNGVAGLSGTVTATNGYLSFYFTDTNGYFYAPVYVTGPTNSWTAPVDAFGAAFQGLLSVRTNVAFNATNKVNLTNALAPATAIFYGSVSNGSAGPMPGVYVYAQDNKNHQSIGMTDSHGNYVVGVSPGTNIWQLYLVWPNDPGLTNNSYVFGPDNIFATGFQTNQAVQQDFSVLTAPYHISGSVLDYDGNPVVGAQVFATNDIYQAVNAQTASDGSYTLNVAPGTWTVGLDSNSLVSVNQSYTNIPPNQTVTISGSDVSGVNFLIQVCSEIEILTTNLPDAIVGGLYDGEIQAQGCNPISKWSPAYGITLTSIHDNTNVFYPAGTPIYSDNKRIGFVESSFSFGVGSTGNIDSPFFINCTGNAPADTGGGGFDFENLSASVSLSGPINSATNITVYFPNVANGSQLWTATPTTQNGSNYTTTLSFAVYSKNPMALGGDVAVNPGSEMLLQSGTSSNRISTIVGGFHSIPAVGNFTVAASSARFTNQDNSVVWIQWGTNIGEYFISAYGPQSTNLPPNLQLYPDGSYTAAITGTPTGIGTNGGLFNFSVMAEDTSSNVTVQPLSIFVFPATSLTGPSSSQAGTVQSSNTFQMSLKGLTNEFNYTVFMTTNLAPANWVPIFTTNNPVTNTAIVPDTTATDATRFYRVQISQ